MRISASDGWSAPDGWLCTDPTICVLTGNMNRSITALTLEDWVIGMSTSVMTWSVSYLSLIHISEPTRRTPISYAVFCLKKKKKQNLKKKKKKNKKQTKTREKQHPKNQ